MKNYKKKTAMLLLLLALLVMITVGTTYAFFSYMKKGSTENTITTGSLMFIYDEMSSLGNGINLVNTLPISDTLGKELIGNNQVFDFQILANNSGSSINYEIIAEKLNTSTLAENMTKIYLTTVTGSIETEITTTVKDNIITTYNELTPTSIIGQVGKTLHQEIIPKGSVNYNKQFRLRIWLSEKATNQTDGNWDYNNQTFSLKVNVIANGET